MTIYHGDALEVMASLPRASVGIVCMDPPYSSGARQAAQLRNRRSMRTEDGPYGGSRWIGGDNLTSHGFQMLMRLVGVESLRITVNDGHLLSFIDWRQLPVLQGTLEAAGWSPRSLLVWDKVYMGMGNGFRRQIEFCLHASKGIGENFARKDVADYTAEYFTFDGTPAQVSQDRRVTGIDHPTPKPPGTVARWLSALPPSLVCDPFMGSGQTLIAAQRIGYPAIGIEEKEEHCETAAQLLEQIEWTPAPPPRVADAIPLSLGLEDPEP